MAINLSRNTRLWVSTVTTGHNNSNTFELPVQEGYGLSQSVATADVSVEEAGPTPTRGGKRFNTNLDPVEWSFATYFNPYALSDTASTPNEYKFAVDMLMWHALASGNSVPVNLDNDAWDVTGPTPGAAKVFGDTDAFKVDFSNNSAHVLTKLYLYFKIDSDVFFVSGAQVGQAEIAIDIADIAMTSWSGNALSYSRLGSEPSFIAAGGASYDDSTPTAGYVAIPDNKVFLINKLTTMDFQSDVADTTDSQVMKHYSTPLTSGSITINNNVTYLTPNTLSQVDAPIGSFTGAFEVTGTLDAYMRSTGGSGATKNTAKGTTELLEDMLSNPGKITNVTNATLFIGGEAAGSPQVKLSIPTMHIAVPSLSVDDVISTSIEFKAIPTSTDLQSGDEISIEMTPEQS